MSLFFSIFISLASVSFCHLLGSCLKCLENEEEGSQTSFFLSTINRSSKSYALAILGAEYCLRLLPPGTHDWYKFRTPDETEQDLASHGYEVKISQGLVPSMVEASASDASSADLMRLALSGSALKSWALSDTDKDVNYIVHATKKTSGVGS